MNLILSLPATLPKFEPEIVSNPFKADVGLNEFITGENVESYVKVNFEVS